MADFKLAQTLRKESVEKYNEADTALRTVHELTQEIRHMESEIKLMKSEAANLEQHAHVLRLEGDRLKNQAFTMSLGALNE